MDSRPKTEHLVEVPYSELPEKTLNKMVESFVLREGTDYGNQEYSLEKKVSQVLSQLKHGEVRVVFDSNDESFDIRKK